MISLTVVITTVKRLRQEDRKFKASLGFTEFQASFNYKVRPYLKHINKTNKSCVKYPNKDLQKHKHQETQEILLHSHTNGSKSKIKY